MVVHPYQYNLISIILLICSKTQINIPNHLLIFIFVVFPYLITILIFMTFGLDVVLWDHKNYINAI